jgi:hypothetical protein
VLRQRYKNFVTNSPSMTNYKIKNLNIKKPV